MTESRRNHTAVNVDCISFHTVINASSTVSSSVTADHTVYDSISCFTLVVPAECRSFRRWLDASFQNFGIKGTAQRLAARAM